MITKNPLFSYDVELTGRMIEHLITTVTAEWLETRRQNNGNVHRQLATRFIGTQFLRDWYIPSKYMLVTEELRDSIGDAPKVLMTIGSAHGAVGQRMAECGLKPREIFLARVASWTATARSELNLKGRIDRDRAEGLL